MVALQILLMLLGCRLEAERGLVVAANDHFVPALEKHLYFLYDELKCDLLCEIWHAGSELSEANKKQLRAFPKVRILDLMDYEEGPSTQYQGFQIKGMILYHTQLEEVILMDADLIFFQNPACLFEHPGYKETGAFFFRDRRLYVVPYRFSGIQNSFAKMRGNLPFYKKQCAFFRHLIERPGPSMPLDWRHYWEEGEPSIENKVTTEKQEAGCVVIDKTRHRVGVRSVYELNCNHEKTYRWVWGDKETYWLGFEMAKETYFVNPEYPWTLQYKEEKVDIVQFVDGRLFYEQKLPISVHEGAFFTEHVLGKRGIYESERDQLNRVALFFQSPVGNRRCDPNSKS